VEQLVKYTKELSKLLSASDNIIIVCHINPDGDAIGSQLAFYHYLDSIGKKAVMLSPNNLQEFLKWMVGSDEIMVYTRERKNCNKILRNADLIIMLDFNQSDRLGEAEKEVMASAARKVIIDHHLDPSQIADLLISDTTKCSTAELVHELITQMNGGVVFQGLPYAEAIYTGIITDTGRFEHGSYSGNTLRIVAGLIESGINKELIQDRIYNNFSASRMKLLGFALSERMHILPDYKTAYIYLTRKDLDDHKHVKGDTEGFVNMPLSISGIIFSVLFIEKDGFVKLSFRSKGNFPVNKFASDYFYGGGHLNASGGEIKGTLQNAIEYFLKILASDFSKYEGS